MTRTTIVRPDHHGIIRCTTRRAYDDRRRPHSATAGNPAPKVSPQTAQSGLFRMTIAIIALIIAAGAYAAYRLLMARIKRDIGQSGD